MGFWGLLWQSILLGIAAAFTPSLIALQILIVSGDPWRRRSLAVAVGGSSAFLLVGALLFFGFAQLPDVSDGAQDPVGAWLRVGAGLALIPVAVFLFRPHPQLRARVDTDVTGYAAHASLWVFVGVAFALSIKDLSSFIVLAPALHDIAVADVNAAEQAVLLAVLYAFALSPVLAPPGLRLVFGHRLDGFFAGAYRFTLDHQFQLVGVMAALISAYLLVSGIARL
jgi:hypothetical protein